MSPYPAITGGEQGEGCCWAKPAARGAQQHKRCAPATGARAFRHPPRRRRARRCRRRPPCMPLVSPHPAITGGEQGEGCCWAKRAARGAQQHKRCAPATGARAFSHPPRRRRARHRRRRPPCMPLVGKPKTLNPALASRRARPATRTSRRRNVEHLCVHKLFPSSLYTIIAQSLLHTPCAFDKKSTTQRVACSSSSTRRHDALSWRCTRAAASANGGCAVIASPWICLLSLCGGVV